MKTCGVTLNLLGPELGQTLAGVFALDGNAFIAGVAYHDGLVAVLIVLIAGFSGAVGQSIVLFANRVKPGRFFFSLLVDAVLFTFGYAFLVLSTWVVCRLPGTPHFSFRTLALVFGLSYAPLLFSFLGALPYLGSSLLRILRVWHLLAMVVGVAAVGSVDVFRAATYVLLGWFVMTFAQRSFGKPITDLGVSAARCRRRGPHGRRRRYRDRHRFGRRQQSRASRARGACNPKARSIRDAGSRSSAWAALAVFTVIVALALDPVRESVFGWQEHLPRILQLPFDLLWLVLIAVIVSAFMAPFETLGWWAGWFGDKIDTSDEANPPERQKSGFWSRTLSAVSRRHRPIQRKVHAGYRDVSRRARAGASRQRAPGARRNGVLGAQ